MAQIITKESPGFAPDNEQNQIWRSQIPGQLKNIFIDLADLRHFDNFHKN